MMPGHEPKLAYSKHSYPLYAVSERVEPHTRKVSFPGGVNETKGTKSAKRVARRKQSRNP